MIQRVQTIWLFLASLTLFLLLFLPVMSGSGTGVSFYILPQTPLHYATALVTLLTFINIFNFKKRSLQKRLIFLIIVLIIGLSAWIFLSAQQFPGGVSAGTPAAGAFMPLLSLLFVVLALRGIRKDESLLRSADRLR